MTIKENNHWSSKSEAARDEVRDAVADSVSWLVAHRKQALWTAGTVAAASLLLALFLYSRRARIDAAWDKLSLAELYAYSGHPDEARKALDEVIEGGASPAASAMALMLQGDMLYPRGDYEKALAAYDRAAAEGSEQLKPFALAEKAMALEAAPAKSAECAAAAEGFLSAYPEHLLAPQVHSTLARCQAAAGQADAAKATLQRISLQYPNTPWAAWASGRLQPAAK